MTRYNDSGGEERTACVAAAALCLIAWVLVGPNSLADEPGLIDSGQRVAPADPGWIVDTSWYTGAATTLLISNGSSSSYQAVTNTLSIDLYSPTNPVSAGAFLDHRIGLSGRHEQVFNAGGWLKRKFRGWDATGYVFLSKPSGADDALWVAGRLRRVIADGHKLGIEAAAPVEELRAPFVALSYDGSLTERLSLKVSAGKPLDDGPDVVSRVELTWQGW